MIKVILKVPAIRKVILHHLVKQLTLQELVALGFRIRKEVATFDTRPKVSALKTAFARIRKVVRVSN